ncbi:MAG: TetR/AcrR family transcriptional regulator [Gemmatimonadaceae bacterium]|nr:TetR/AcrR family transcriptional regulator [Gemmatimonadaceae bacterium]
MKTEDSSATRRRAGRPLSFDRDVALRQAMLAFWRHGYEATSLADLTAAMDVTPPSIYAAFRSKKSLFLEAVRLYVGEPASSTRIIADAATARDAVRGLLEASVIGFTGADTPPGCLLASAAISCSAQAGDVQAELASMRIGIEAQLRERLARGVCDGDLHAATEVDSVAAHVMAVIQGLSTLARDGATRAKLDGVVREVMRGIS